jgi:hypothetical protein
MPVDQKRSAACKVAWDTIRRNLALKAAGQPIPKPAKQSKRAPNPFKSVAPIPTTQPEPITTIADIADRAMLVRLSIGKFNPKRIDKKISREVAQQHGIDEAMGRYEKSIVDTDSLEAARQLESAIRQEHYRRTLPWGEDGARILTSAGYFAYAEFMREAKGKWDPVVDAYLSNWDTFKADAKRKLNGAYREEDYPTKAQLRAKFSFTWKVEPVPTANDFRVSLGANEVAAIRSQIEGNLKATLDEATQEIWVRLKKVVAKMSERLHLYDPQNPADASFRDTLVTNITDLLDVVPSLNVTGDPNITAFVSEIRANLTKHSADALRDSDHAREATAKAADDILSRMGEFFA